MTPAARKHVAAALREARSTLKVVREIAAYESPNAAYDRDQLRGYALGGLEDIIKALAAAVAAEKGGA